MDIAISLIGGLGLFLYGMNLMGNGLQKSAGEKLKNIIGLLTSNIFMGVLVGTLVTGVIQSSSATTVMVVGFVNAGIMTLNQAIGVIMGANIGTTVTAQLVSFNLEELAPIALGIGIILFLFSKKPKIKNIAEILIGFGILFTGMEFMKDAVKPLAEYQGFRDALIYFGKHQILGILAGFAITGIVQSSSASMGMLIALSTQGLLPITSALPILYGDNIGTCVTSLISSIGANINAKRAAVMHLTFNIIGTLLFMIILNKPIVALVNRLDPNDVARQIANAHTLFNVINVIILIPFAKVIVNIAMKIVPEKESEIDEKETKYLDERILETPTIAVGNVKNEIIRMGNKSKLSLESSIESFMSQDMNKVNKTMELEHIINNLQKSILNYLLKLSKRPLDDNEREIIDLMFNTVNDIERIGDHAENIAELSKEYIDDKLSLSSQGKEEIKDMYKKVLEGMDLSLKSLEKNDKDIARNVLKIEEEVNAMNKSFRANHMIRLNQNNCDIDAGIIYLDFLSNLERISDHAVNIAQSVL
ncbi:sodium:phosphate symporter [[Clostridium] sordellii]|uniref:Na/Pi cotransporter family protein n=1 Tax=Paraclostridium sordellii TaxID=1505 RepID=UPI0002E42815|nr:MULTISPECIES: Na/Pi cotransporter family protein [Paeniclostridium]MDU5020831.1 Na/Pi cotransporter family protein [Clostridiales bacterium]AUN13961.1 sodium-dependent phosphate transporter [Paeniclostridium sordellii]EPZ57630.1 na+/Pi-cotransporter family protein [[Clostridium] sordellii VPI 9048] [Paeniclostridium sordellii VPI 9048]MBW4862817.1 Na/Pi cotransporter family protein [Paeniclostridium sp.]MBW4875286.1 Na/Pi cotransporter family protein [Paeniclostridium sp.]